MNYKGPGIYRHYKGNQYHVVGLGRLESRLHGGTYVLYRQRGVTYADKDFWIRPLYNFNATVKAVGHRLGDVLVPRFMWERPLPEEPAQYLVEEGTGNVQLVDSAAKQLAEDVMSIAETAGVPSSFYLTDQRLLRAKAILNGESIEEEE